MWVIPLKFESSVCQQKLQLQHEGNKLITIVDNKLTTIKRNLTKNLVICRAFFEFFALQIQKNQYYTTLH